MPTGPWPACLARQLRQERMRRLPMGCVVDHPWFPTPITLQEVVHDAESLQSSCQPTGTTTPACRPLTVGPPTYTTATRLPPSLRDGSRGSPVRDPNSPHCPDHCGEAVPCLTCTLGAKEPAGPYRTSNNEVSGTGPAPGLVAVGTIPPMVRGPGTTTRAGFWLVLEPTIAEDSWPHANLLKNNAIGTSRPG